MDLLTNLRQQKLRKCFLEKRKLFAARTAYPGIQTVLTLFSPLSDF